ncbi:apaH [Wigglesworthia glossinidia endosymbiont of Glossina brevipalpis]|uniref:Bis(5'-nucleosyl)-tetraphosphatase, symmetrical n=1 Tax=Wigglesworthia glossinidia brevipalpis TaxID=36870 RepID=APAH_WIGBR|nr:RecName: Full=Bis(5'-nucleosyl)-tetraphosphatase, symmetrical; AltName: Full=Ap4A hydrolase; AltName: Full=Diadenosine 5',5'''-P1,P4-tetraphosphate pyrophosphohydrolase; AltName: Full=Diadenosine tetraphosphatase [Wigglesworthia glossinidia endosymbiont of Glossina brevipalpis]BAC24167.1 apaH [Wigglesworthia glossinidia endosymbiont of Glossina brevipalpis]
MSHYLIGDIHGCYSEFKSMLDLINFNLKNDIIWIAGDFIGRGPDSLKVLRLIYKLKRNIFVVLGNHEINLLLLYAKIKKIKEEDKLTEILNAPDLKILISWLRKQPLLKIDKQKKIIMIHAGIIPKWDMSDLITNSKKVECELKSKNYKKFLKFMYIKNNEHKNIWKNNLPEIIKMRLTLNIITRIRYCISETEIDLLHKEHPEKSPNHLIPWFKFKNNITKNYSIVFGHWSSIKDYKTPKNIYGLDTGCCWKGELTALKWDNKLFFKIKSK